MCVIARTRNRQLTILQAASDQEQQQDKKKKRTEGPSPIPRTHSQPISTRKAISSAIGAPVLDCRPCPNCSRFDLAAASAPPLTQARAILQMRPPVFNWSPRPVGAIYSPDSRASTLTWLACFRVFACSERALLLSPARSRATHNLNASCRARRRRP